ncbi:unnamed protein product [Moneuplotes crassus]|uniref:Uncharacterized protein n=1 Tax=Euplotes crassus TaxID=5936 RepID=A0AAD1XTA3_EUPCR|nr:unnamed protein product [Moneuplotes crassus]
MDIRFDMALRRRRKQRDSQEEPDTGTTANLHCDRKDYYNKLISERGKKKSKPSFSIVKRLIAKRKELERAQRARSADFSDIALKTPKCFPKADSKKPQNRPKRVAQETYRDIEQTRKDTIIQKDTDTSPLKTTNETDDSINNEISMNLLMFGNTDEASFSYFQSRKDPVHLRNIEILSSKNNDRFKTKTECDQNVENTTSKKKMTNECNTRDKRLQVSKDKGCSLGNYVQKKELEEDEDIWEDSMVEHHTYFGMGPYAIEAKVDEQMFLACGQESHLSSINPSLLSSFVLNYGEVKEMARSTSVDEN